MINPAKVVKALRCSHSLPEPDLNCTDCEYYSAAIGLCDVDGIAMDAAELLEMIADDGIDNQELMYRISKEQAELDKIRLKLDLRLAMDAFEVEEEERHDQCDINADDES